MKHLSTHIDDRLAVDGPSPEQTPTLPDPAERILHLSLRLWASEAAAVRRAAAARGVKPAQWLRSVVRVRLGAGTQYSASELHELRALTNQVRRIGVNLNQLARAAHEARLEQVPFAVDTRVLATACGEVERILAALHSMARGNVRFWEGLADGE
ncbi:hypothetical protein CU102_23170 [Phyllobacterium brassicacearum]|uniref:Bacterial mobilisation domain-containing protein n=1 Tax=Phyllobacterium brassicacearum TaxID=314235 RepID=A0A2P7BBB0_9HYPH|nr:plasmid mobilization relaxosome protein MobC [Phyllobacterium brassicacearum]PSH63761.1 hypothetical protein CU102_23170 [Phyllobacterium brassicacearum]TDQ31953.1 mobilization protein MobC [Phyllobacterium brassicacearum]